DELREVSMAGAGTIGHRLVDDPSQRRFRQFDADFLTHFSPEAVVGSLPAFEEAPGSEPRSSFRFWLDADEDDRPAAVMDQSARGPEGSAAADPESRILRRSEPSTPRDRDATEPGEGVAHAILALPWTHPDTEDGNLIKAPSEFPAAHEVRPCLSRTFPTEPTKSTTR